MSFFKLGRRVAVAAAAVATLAAVTTVPAHASSTPLKHYTLKRGMYLEGFNAPAAIYYQWFISLNDANGSSTQSAGGYLAADLIWTGTWKNLYQYEYSIDEVLSDDSYATLDNGEVCSSAGPWVVISGLN
jgi:hypothetical protein